MSEAGLEVRTIAIDPVLAFGRSENSVSQVEFWRQGEGLALLIELWVASGGQADCPGEHTPPKALCGALGRTTCCKLV